MVKAIFFDVDGTLVSFRTHTIPPSALEALHAQAPAVKCRLIPYRAVGAGGLLLAVQCDQVTIGGKPAGPLVAFAPDRLSAAGEYEALTGGGQYV